MWLGSGLQLEVQAKVDAQVDTWLRRRLFLKGREEVCAVYIFPLILYRLSVLPLPKNHRQALQRSLSKVIWWGRRLMVRRQVCCQRLRNGGLGMLDLETHWFAERLAYLGRFLSVWRLKASDTFPRLKSNSKAEGQRKLRGEPAVVCECRKAFCNLPGSSDLSRPRKELYQELVVGSALALLVDRLGSAGRWRQFARIEIGRQVRASWTNPSSRSSGCLYGTRCPFSVRITKWAW